MKTLQRILTLALFLVVTTATATAAGEWIEIGTQDGVKYSMYTKITTDYAGNHSVWIQQEYVTKAARAKTLRDFKLKRTPFSQKLCWKYNSSFSECSLSSSVFYSAKGNVLTSYNAPYEDFNPIVPGTLGESWAEMAQYLYNLQEGLVSGVSSGGDEERLFEGLTSGIQPQEIPNPVEDNRVFVSVEQMPQFPGGDAALMRFIAEHLQYPGMARQQGIQGKVIVQFAVTKTGSVGEVKVVRSLSPDCDNEAKRVVRSLPKFTPGKQTGKPVTVWYTLPITFKLQDKQ